MHSSTLDRIQPGTRWKSRVTGIEVEVTGVVYTGKTRKIEFQGGGVAGVRGQYSFLQVYEYAQDC